MFRIKLNCHTNFGVLISIKKLDASTHLPADISVKFFVVFTPMSVQLDVAVLQRSERFVLPCKLNQTAPDNGYCKGRQAGRERTDIWLSDV